MKKRTEFINKGGQIVWNTIQSLQKRFRFMEIMML